MNHALHALCLSLLLNGCATTTSYPPPAAPAAEALLAEQHYAEAAQAFSDAAASESRGRDALRLRAAEAWLAAGNTEAARGALAQVPSRALTPADKARRALVTAELALHDGDAEAALAQLTPSGLTLPPTLVLQRQRLRAQALERTGAAFAAARELAAIDRLVPAPERSANRIRIADLLTGVDSDSLRTQGAMLPSDDILIEVDVAVGKGSARAPRLIELYLLGPPAATLYAVDPVGVAMMMPSPDNSGPGTPST